MSPNTMNRHSFALPAQPPAAPPSLPWNPNFNMGMNMNMNPMANGSAGPVPMGRKSREGSLFSNPDHLSVSTPITPADSPYTPSSRHAFSPITSSGLASSFPNNSFSSAASTTPVEAPSWTTNGHSVGGFNWNNPQNNGWPEVQAQQQHQQHQHQHQQHHQQPIPQAAPSNVTSNEDLDPALFETLAELLEQTHKANGNGDAGPNGEFDLMQALQQAIADTTVPTPQPQAAPQMPSFPQQGNSGMSQSLLTRRLQQHGGQTQGIPPSFSSFNSHGASLGTSPLLSSSGPQHQTSLGSSFGAESVGSLSTSQGFSSSLHNMRQSKLTPIPQTPWPLPDRQMGYSETPVSTPGGSEGYGSPAGPSSYTSVHFPSSSSGPSRNRPPVMPIRREAPQHPAPQSPHGRSHGSTSSSFQAQQSMPHPSQASQSNPQPPVIDWAAASNLDMASLPPLPPGFSMDQFGQGAAGLEMAIRMGMSLAMMNQGTSSTAQSPNGAGSTPASYGPSNPVSVATSPADSSRKHPTLSMNIKPQGPKGEGLSQSLSSRHTESTSPLDTAQIASSFPASRRPSQGENDNTLAELISPEEAAKNDPLAAQVWKAYAKAREALPNGQRMENLTWRMMHLTLKKREELAAAAAAKEEQERQAAAAAANAIATSALQSESTSTSTSNDGEQRGRRKGKSRVVGFHKEDSPAPE